MQKLLATIACIAIGASSARALPVTIGLSTNLGDPITIPMGASGDGHAIFVGAFGSFPTNIVTGDGSPPATQPKLDATSVDVTTSAPAIIVIYVTEQNLTSPTGIHEFRSSFTTNQFIGAGSVQMSTLIDLSNGLFGGTLLGGPVTFSAAPNNAVSIDTTPDLVAPYSVTERFVVDFTGLTSGVGISNSTIDLQEVRAPPIPEPASLAVLYTGLVGLGLLFRRRVRRS